MPRIDPERLLKCLQPLLDPSNGAIRSADEVDKILGLMSKFSKKLVSKCIYINILSASHPPVVDLFMERGGWNLVFGWTNDAIANKNYPLLKAIFTLLLTTPVTVPRLKSNRFPIVIKNFSKDCEDEETKNICKQVVSRWITVAKTENKTDTQQQVAPPAPSPVPVQQPPPPPQQLAQAPVPAPVQQTLSNSIQLIDPVTGIVGGGVTSTPAGELPNLGNMNTDHLLNIDPASMSMLPDGDGSHQNLMDLDLSHADLSGIDFNLDILNKLVVDGHTLEEAIAAGGGGVIQQQQPPIQQQHQVIDNMNSVGGAPISVIQHAPPTQIPIQHQQQLIIQGQQGQGQQIILQDQHGLQHHHPQAQVIQIPQQQQQIQQPIMVPTTTNVILTPNNVVSQQAPHQQYQIIQQQPGSQIPQKEDPQQQQMISFVQVQPQQPPPTTTKLYIKTVGGQRSVVQDPVVPGPGQYCLMVKDGKNYLVRLKEQSPNMLVTSSPQTMVVQQQMSITSQAGQGQVPDNKVPPLVISQKSQDIPDGGGQVSTKKGKSSRKEGPQIISPVNKVPVDVKTYSKSKSSSSSTTSSTTSSSSSTSKEKKSSENVKPSDKDKDNHKSSKSKSSSSSSDGHHKRSKSSSSTGQTKAALAAQQAKEDERLKEKIRREKAQMKKRQKEMDKQKQQSEKDQETLKKLNLLIPMPNRDSSTSPGGGGGGSSGGGGASGSSTGGGSTKIPKIPKRSNSSFADAIGIPGSDGFDKIKKISPEKDKSKDKEKSPSQNLEDAKELSPTRKFYGKKEEEVQAEDKAKERRHKPKVFVSSKSRSDDLLKEMTESGKNNNKSKEQKEKEAKEKEEKESKEKVGGGSGATGISLGNSIPATPPKIAKRLSTDSLEKPGDPKKAKLVEKKESVKDKIRKSVIKESSMFMEAISATETTKSTKKKRRTSSGGDSKDAPKPGELTGGNELVDEVTTPTEDKKPVFNFYRDTLNDEDDEIGGKIEESMEENDNGGEDKEKMEEDDGGSSNTGSFTPQENDGKVKSALVLVRPRNRKKKFVRWREEDELREFHYFEMDETERVNVTKQKDFTDLSSNEMAIEGSFLKRRGEEEEQDKQKPWKMMKILFSAEILTPQIISTERAAQEEREKNVLGLFLPPGSILPDCPVEADVGVAAGGEKPEPKLIPVEDVNTITKVCDYRTHQWPDPKGGATVPAGGAYNMMMNMGRGFGGVGVPPPSIAQRNQMDGHHQFPGGPPPPGHMPQFPPQMVPNPTLSPTGPPAADFGNPWSANLGSFSVPPAGVPPPPVVPDMAFGQFGGPSAAVAAAAAMGMMGQAIPPPPGGLGFPPNPFAFPPPASMMNGPPPGAAPNMDFGPGRGGGSNHRGGSRFDGGNERRNNNFHGGSRDGGSGRDRGDRSASRDRDYRGGGGDDRSGRDRDYRSRGGERGGASGDKDYRNHHERGGDRSGSRDNRGGGGRNIRKEIPCRFFKKGFCSNGGRCEFLHEGGSSSSSHSDRRRSPPASDHHHSSSRHQNSASSSNSNSNDDEDWETPASSKDIPDSAQSPPQEEQAPVQQAPAQVISQHQRPSRFSDAPMSPTEDSPSSPIGSFSSAAESTKVIPV